MKNIDHMRISGTEPSSVMMITKSNKVACKILHLVIEAPLPRKAKGNI